jgi:proline racemase
VPRSSCSILVDIRLILEHGIYARRTVFDFGWRRQAVCVWDLKENKAVRTIRRHSGPCDEGKIDRSPTGTGCSARMAVWIARGLMAWGGVYRARSIIGSGFVCRIARPTTIGGRPGIVPTISDRGLDYRRQPVYARPGRSVALALSARGHLAAR